MLGQSLWLSEKSSFLLPQYHNNEKKSIYLNVFQCLHGIVEQLKWALKGFEAIMFLLLPLL